MAYGPNDATSSISTKRLLALTMKLFSRSRGGCIIGPVQNWLKLSIWLYTNTLTCLNVILMAYRHYDANPSLSTLQLLALTMELLSRSRGGSIIEPVQNGLKMVNLFVNEYFRFHKCGKFLTCNVLAQWYKPVWATPCPNHGALK
jgi:hypothetical protein